MTTQKLVDTRNWKRAHYIAYGGEFTLLEAMGLS